VKGELVVKPQELAATEFGMRRVRNRRARETDRQPKECDPARVIRFAACDPVYRGDAGAQKAAAAARHCASRGFIAQNRRKQKSGDRKEQ